MLLRHCLVNISTRNIDKVVSLLLPQCQRNLDEPTLTQLSFSTKHQHQNNIGSSIVNRSKSINIVLTLFFQRWNNVDKHTSAQLSFSSQYQRWNNVGSSVLNRHNSIDIISTLLTPLKQLPWIYVGSTFIYNQISM